MMLHHGMELSLSCILNCKELLKTLCTWILGKINYSVHLHNDLFDIRTDIRWSTRSEGFSSINFITWYIYWLFMPRFDWIFSNPMVSMTHSTHLYTSICGPHNSQGSFWLPVKSPNNLWKWRHSLWPTFWTLLILDGNNFGEFVRITS